MSTSAPAVSLGSPMVRDDRDARGHKVRFYSEDTFLLDELSRFIGAALGAGDAGLVIATREHREELARRLEARGFDLAHARGQGRYVTVDAAEILATFQHDGQLDRTRFGAVIGGLLARGKSGAHGEQRRVAVFGEMVALLWVRGQTETALQLEHLWNGLAATHAFSLHCAYPLHLFRQVHDGAALESICAAHTHVLPAESYAALTTDDERLRAITLLQHKAEALETELAEHQRTQEVLRERNEALRAALTVREEFLSMAAHELKTPVTSLRGVAQLLLRTVRRQGAIAPERLESALETIDQQTGTLRQLMERLLDTARMHAGTLPIAPEATDLVTLVHAALARYRGADHQIVVAAGAEHLVADVDATRFEQVITNLVDNAIKFSPRGSSIAVALGSDDDGGIRLSVTDQGSGIAPEQRSLVFDRFQQIHNERHRTGLGLGLYITREIVELHGGSVRIEDPGHPGTRFVVTLPPPAGVARIAPA